MKCIGGAINQGFKLLIEVKRWEYIVVEVFSLADILELLEGIHTREGGR